MMDSGAFTELATHGKYRHGVEDYAREIERWRNVGTLVCAVSQDFMCEPHMLAKTGLTVVEHQTQTTERYMVLRSLVRGVYVLPVLQGFDPSEYAVHVRSYGDLIAPGAWVGVGSVCKRQGSPEAIVAVLRSILSVRPDLRLHGFGVKLSSLRNAEVRSLLATADSMAWSYSARKQGRSANDWREAKAFENRIDSLGTH